MVDALGRPVVGSPTAIQGATPLALVVFAAAPRSPTSAPMVSPLLDPNGDSEAPMTLTDDGPGPTLLGRSPRSLALRLVGSWSRPTLTDTEVAISIEAGLRRPPPSAGCPRIHLHRPWQLASASDNCLCW
ncbi:hypothetical protein ZWY2020_020503 [Hordeum vulgare]|nr:hypothetical protein ZWY2020_020503 [Hordeum vulgare]